MLSRPVYAEQGLVSITIGFFSLKIIVPGWKRFRVADAVPLFW